MTELARFARSLIIYIHISEISINMNRDWARSLANYGKCALTYVTVHSLTFYTLHIDHVKEVLYLCCVVSHLIDAVVFDVH